MKNNHNVNNEQIAVVTVAGLRVPVRLREEGGMILAADYGSKLLKKRGVEVIGSNKSDALSQMKSRLLAQMSVTASAPVASSANI